MIRKKITIKRMVVISLMVVLKENEGLTFLMPSNYVYY